MMFKDFLFVGLGGMLGSILRYGCYQVFRGSAFPWGTFVVNIAGSFVIGILSALIIQRVIISEHWRLFWVMGICGGFTTFSAFSSESLQLLQQQRLLVFSLYISGTMLFGVVATFLGYQFIKG